ncbi:amidohydrolase family protein [Marinicella meishanensis]|uniref:amidohydrolase family protein n=1 Tax=Marinicella meishanensis TaxID=2873263 RepID=UPI0021071166|nr:amidohydrolase family protein [Marinicella sp. NBU2979]
MHAFAWNRYGSPPPRNPVSRQLPSAQSDAEVIDQTLAIMAELNITKAIISGPLDDVRRWQEQGGGSFLGGLYYHPRNPLPELDVVIAAHQNKTLSVFGELGLAYGGLYPHDPSLSPYFAYAQEMQIPVGIHMALGEPNLAITWAPEFRVDQVNPLVIEQLVLAYPELKIYLMHAGWPFLDNTKAIMCMFDHIYADLSVINWLLPEAEFQAYLLALMNTAGGECDLSKRLMYGSDQMIWPDAIRLSIENIQNASFLSHQQKADIFFNNAVTFFGLVTD